MFTKTEYTTRRGDLKKLINGGILLFLGNGESSINFKDNWYPFRQDSTFLYFFGLAHPNLCAIIDLDENREIVFGDNLSIDDIVFMGQKSSLKDRALEVGVNDVQSSLELCNFINKARNKNRQVHFIQPYRMEQEAKLLSLFQSKSMDFKEKASVELIKAIIKLRSIKSSTEIVEIEKGVNTTVMMQYRAMELASVGISEAVLYGEVCKIALSRGNGTSFPPIITINGQILHNHFRGNNLKKGDLVLCDCGAETYSSYAGDLTRTFPVDKKFTVKQKEIYDIVHEAYKSAVFELKPGKLFKDIHLIACESIVKGLIQIGLMKGDPTAAVQAGAHTVFFQCGLGHMMGLDVHDMENLGEEYVGYTEDLKQNKEFGFKSLRLGRALESGMVLTVEPGIYMIPELIELRKSQNKFREFINYGKVETYKEFGGIRIEDDFLITSQGSRLLGDTLPTTSDEIERFRESKVRPD